MRNLSDAMELVYVCNNASWAIGEIATSAEKEVRRERSMCVYHGTARIYCMYQIVYRVVPRAVCFHE